MSSRKTVNCLVNSSKSLATKVASGRWFHVSSKTALGILDREEGEGKGKRLDGLCGGLTLEGHSGAVNRSPGIVNTPVAVVTTLFRSPE